MKIVIRCGGAGTRLWPMSRKDTPKHFQALLGSLTLFESKIQEILPLVHTWNDVYISTVREYVTTVRRLAPRILKSHIIAEPVRRNTGPGIALETTVIAAQQPRGVDPVIATLTVDDVMHNAKLFCQLLRRAEALLRRHEPSSVITIGCPPTNADTGLSYLVLGPRVAGGKEHAFHEVTEWIEKPSTRKLSHLLQRTSVAAHTGLYVWKASTVMGIIEAHEPEMFKGLRAIRDDAGTPRFQRTLARVFPRFQSVSVEELVTRRASRVIAAVADLKWHDTGKWFLIQELRRTHVGANVTQGEVYCVDTEDSLIYAPKKKFIATIGLNGMIVIDTGDALLVCPKERSADVKKIVEHLTRTNKKKLL